jgi:histidyl-tRNA synthetase
MKALKGFRDFFPGEWAARQYIFETWREVLRRYGFVEYEAPMLESTELYKKKSGDEIVGQLFNFQTRGEEDVSLRPELTPTLARMVIAREADYKKPLKWFSIGRFFRYERPQEGRLREFYALNADIIGDDSAAADAELVAVCIDVLREFGLTEEDFVIRLSSRDGWRGWLRDKGFDDDQVGAILGIVDKIERGKPEKLEEDLAPFKLTLEEIRAFIDQPGDQYFGRTRQVLQNLEQRGLADYCKIDATVVRGLAYYTGLVFEAFSLGKARRAVAGGGRFDDLLSILSDGKMNLPGMGFGMGDVVLGNVLEQTPAAAELLREDVATAQGVEVYLVIADEKHRPEALALAQNLRDAGITVDYPFTPTKVGKQFGAASSLAERAVVIGGEWPRVSVKDLRTREETELDHGVLVDYFAKLREDELVDFLEDED